MRIYSLLLSLLFLHDSALGETPSPAPPASPITASVVKPTTHSEKVLPPTADELKEFAKAAEEERQELLKKMSPDDKKKLEELAALLKPKASGSLRRRRGLKRRSRLVRRQFYSIDPPYLKPDMVLKDPDGLTKYKPGKYVDSGSFGTIYEGTMVTNDARTEIALKVAPMHWDIIKLPKYTKNDISDRGLQLQNEYKILSILHTIPTLKNFLIKPYALIEYKERLVMPLELAGFGSLDNYVTQNSAKVREQLSILISEIIIAVDELHIAGYAHRDLKPGNIFLKDIGGSVQAVLGDFGSASLLDDHNRKQVGTELYAAPEFWTDPGNVKFETAEAFSVGAILYTMVKSGLPTRETVSTIGKQVGPIIFSEAEFVQQNFNFFALELMQRLCWPDPKQRLSLTDARQHPLVDQKMSYDDYLKKFPLPTDPNGVYKIILPRRGNPNERTRGATPLPLGHPNSLQHLGPQPQPGSQQPQPSPQLGSGFPSGPQMGPQLGPQPSLQLRPQPSLQLGPQPQPSPHLGLQLGPQLGRQPRPRQRLQVGPQPATSSTTTLDDITGHVPQITGGGELSLGASSISPDSATNTASLFSLSPTSASTSSTIVITPQGPTSNTAPQSSSSSVTTSTTTINSANSGSSESGVSGSVKTGEKPPST